jgi:hypothetical protein
MERQWLASAPPEMQAHMKAQLQMQREQELVDLLNKLIKGVDEVSKALVRNIGG